MIALWIVVIILAVFIVSVAMTFGMVIEKLQKKVDETDRDLALLKDTLKL